MPARKRIEDQIFEPELIEAMRFAFQRACEALQLQGTSDAEILATKIIDLAKAGEVDPERLCSKVLIELATRPASGVALAHHGLSAVPASQPAANPTTAISTKPKTSIGVAGNVAVHEGVDDRDPLTKFRRADDELTFKELLAGKIRVPAEKGEVSFWELTPPGASF